MTKTLQNKIEIVAELAQGFEGKPMLASLLLKAAAEAGADAAKFQLVRADELGTPDYKYYGLFKSLEMSDDAWAGLAKYANDSGIALQFDVFGEKSLGLAARLGVDTVKLHSTDLSNLGLLASVADSSVRRVMLGAGGAYFREIETALELVGNKQVVVLLGFQGYPTPNDSNQIARVSTFVERFAELGKVSIGFADHAAPEDPARFSLAAVALGAGAHVFEKHLTLGRNMKLEDHESALNPDEFGEFCRTIRNCEAALGSVVDVEDFGMSDAEQDYRKMVRRHVVAARELPEGKLLEPADLCLKRSNVTDFVTDLDQVYGTVLRRALRANEPMLSADLHDGEQ